MCYEGGNFTLSHSPPSRKEPLGILSFSYIICFFFLCNLDPFTHPNGQSFYRVSELISLTIFALLLGASVNFHPSTINYHFVFFLRSVISLHVYSCTSLTLDFHMWFFSSSWHIQWGTFLLWSPLVHRSFSERAMWLSHFIFKTLSPQKRGGCIRSKHSCYNILLSLIHIVPLSALASPVSLVLNWNGQFNRPEASCINAKQILCWVLAYVSVWCLFPTQCRKLVLQIGSEMEFLI